MNDDARVTAYLRQNQARGIRGLTVRQTRQLRRTRVGQANAVLASLLAQVTGTVSEHADQT